MKFITLAKIFAVYVSIAGICCCNSREEADLESLFILKTFGEFHVTNHGVTCNKELDLYRHYGVTRVCSARHFGDENGKSGVPGFVARIRDYGNTEYISNDLLIERYRNRKGLDYRMHDGGTILISGTSQNQDFSWISNNYRVGVSSFNTEIPKAVIDDYLAKYPPTVPFREIDFDPQKLYKKEANKTFEIIEDIEQKRGSWINLSNKPEWLLVHDQCSSEIKIKCYYGLRLDTGGFGCPITLNDNNKDRRRKFKELKQSTSELKINEDAIPKLGQNPFMRCPADREYYSDHCCPK